MNVTRGETVLIKADGKSFAWKFDTLGTPAFKLQEIAPKDMNVKVLQATPRKSRVSLFRFFFHTSPQQ